MDNKIFQINSNLSNRAVTLLLLTFTSILLRLVTLSHKRTLFCLQRQVRVLFFAAATMTGILPPPPETLRSMCPASRVSLLKQPSLSGIAAGKAAWRRPSSKCTSPASPCAVWRILPRPCGAARYLSHHQ